MVFGMLIKIETRFKSNFRYILLARNLENLKNYLKSENLVQFKQKD